MENASKALIIAGAILLSIVLITLGVLVIGRGQDAIEQTNIDDQVVSTWNQKWTKYEGTSVSGTTVNNLINEVISSNKVNKDQKEKVIYIYTKPKDGSTTANNKIVTKPNSKDMSGGINRIREDGQDEISGTTSCSQYAKSNAKYNIETKVNPYGYVCQINIMYD